MTDKDFFALTKEMRALAEKKGFVFHLAQHWVLKKEKDRAIIWPMIDGYIHAFERQGQYVQHKKYKDFARCLDRRFGDKTT